MAAAPSHPAVPELLGLITAIVSPATRAREYGTIDDRP
jgi:hypothetical protein